MNNVDRLKNRFSEFSDSLIQLADAYDELAINGQTQAHKAIIMCLKEISQGINNLLKLGDKIEFDDKELSKLLKGYGVRISDTTMWNVGDKYKKIAFRACLSKGQCITTNELAKFISEFFERKYISFEGNRNVVTREWYEYTFVMAPMFKSLWHVANACKDFGKVSGDCFSYMTPVCGKEVLSIVDGCGFGALANHDSKLVIELLEDFLNAGFSHISAISMINAAFAINDNIGTPQTLDMCVMDMYLGVCSFVKLGAVSTFIKRRDWVEIIKSTTLPMGVLDTIDYDNTVKKLYDGDVIFMLSDGVLEAFGDVDKEEVLLKHISKLSKGTPKQMAEEILSVAIKASGGEIYDDMTVGVIMISFTNRKN